MKLEPEHHSLTTPATYRSPWHFGLLGLGIAISLTVHTLDVNSVLKANAAKSLVILAASSTVIALAAAIKLSLTSALKVPVTAVLATTLVCAAFLGWFDTTRSGDILMWTQNQRIGSAALTCANAAGLCALIFFTLGEKTLTISQLAAVLSITLTISSNSAALANGWPALLSSFLAFLLFLLSWDRSAKTTLFTQNNSGSSQLAHFGLAAVSASVSIITLIKYASALSSVPLLMAVIAAGALISSAALVVMTLQISTVTETAQIATPSSVWATPDLAEQVSAHPALSTQSPKAAAGAHLANNRSEVAASTKLSSALAWFREIRTRNFSNEFDLLRNDSNTNIEVGDIAAISDDLDLPDEFTSPILLTQKKDLTTSPSTSYLQQAEHNNSVKPASHNNSVNLSHQPHEQIYTGITLEKWWQETVAAGSTQILNIVAISLDQGDQQQSYHNVVGHINNSPWVFSHNTHDDAQILVAVAQIPTDLFELNNYLQQKLNSSGANFTLVKTTAEQPLKAIIQRIETALKTPNTST